MPYCPECKTEYNPGVTACADCGATLVDELPPIPQHVEVATRLLTTCKDVIDAGMLADNLKSAGIEAFILSQADSNYVSPMNMGLSMVKVLVREEDYSDALEYLKNSANDFLQEGELPVE